MVRTPRWYDSSRRSSVLGYAASELAVISAPRLKGMLARLRDHHAIEDFEYFPAFRALEPTLVPGFDALASDHARLQRQVDEALGSRLVPLGDEGLREKFMGLVAPVLGKAQASALAQLVWTLEEVENVRPLVDAMAKPVA